MAHFTRTFLRGLLWLLPISITLYAVYWFCVTAETLLREVLLLVVPERYYIPGISLLITVVLIYLLGLLSRTWLLRTVKELGEKLFESIPLIKTIYGTLRDLTHYFDSSSKERLGKPVIVRSELQWSMEDTMRFILTAGVSSPGGSSQA